MQDALARSWVHHYRLRIGAPAVDISPEAAARSVVPGPTGPSPFTAPPPAAAPGDPFQQLLAAWRRLVAEWVSRGAPGVMNPELARELLSGTAARAVPGPHDQPDIAGTVWEAFQTALQATQFYSQLEARAAELAREHWPFIAIAVGTALGSAVTMGVHGNDWRALATLSERLRSFAHADIDLGSNTQLQLALESSEALRPDEQGVVIGVSPSIGIRWQLGQAALTIRSQANMRFQTGQDSDRGFGFDWSLTPLNVQLTY
jgi:hypothetical protein